MTTQPSTGTTWIGAHFSDLGPEFLRRGKEVAVLCRDARGAATDLSPHNPDGSVRWSPFAVDDTWRGDLVDRFKVGAFWEANPSANEGFFNCGAFKDGNGPTRKPKITNDHFMIVQNNFPYDTDLVDESEAFAFTPVDTANPGIQRLRNNQHFQDANGNSLIEFPGLPNAGWSRLLNSDNPDRQFLLVRERKFNGLPIYSVDGFPLAKLDNIGTSKMDKKDSEGAELEYLPVPDGICMGFQDGIYQPILTHTWWGGPGWAALNGSPIDEWTVTLGTQASGTFTLTWGVGGTTATIAYNATNTAVKSALVALDDGYSSSNWTVTGSPGGPYTITTPTASLLTGDGSLLGTPGTFVIAPVA